MLMEKSLKMQITFQCIMNLLTIAGLPINNTEQYKSNQVLKNEGKEINFSQDNESISIEENQNWMKKIYEFYSSIFKINGNYLEICSYNFNISLFSLLFILTILFLFYICQLITKKNVNINHFKNLGIYGDLVYFLFSLVSSFSFILNTHFNYEVNQYLSKYNKQQIIIDLILCFCISFLLIISLILQFTDFLRLERKNRSSFIQFSIQVSLFFICLLRVNYYEHKLLWLFVTFVSIFQYINYNIILLKLLKMIFINVIINVFMILFIAI